MHEVAVFCLQYGPVFNEIAGIELEKYDEINCTILGLHLLITTLPDEMYTFEVRVSLVSAVETS